MAFVAVRMHVCTPYYAQTFLGVNTFIALLIFFSRSSIITMHYGVVQYYEYITKIINIM